MLDEDLLEKLWNYLVEEGLSYRDIADKLGFKSRATVCNWFNRGKISSKNKSKIIDLLEEAGY